MENVTSMTASRVAARVMKDVRPLFYLELPSTSSFQHVTEVPDYIKQVSFSLSLSLSELLILPP